ncbi:hypothetical protein VITU102760_12215 [Vibrio tubiashii]|uniref:Uncharacterized protein n=1 Tax=Vibrio tubiashii ATCC 19109 TaxID=1051646 RepID=F9SZY5_9VIBR|nr:hypothetical protein [Vibrio tubiashii]AIW16286.1 hypothetical protein IX91_19520 [Vibrio tubiashii ATCC 19109]EGU59063.1 hypothetical protein VITU9109_18955 [Vibrio tubiashii ATCC 19109]EIF05935.1 hypothetical protein VT1337_00805 [Vibrio tubiashii NCIMB 1337 = ATCC 19106]
MIPAMGAASALGGGLSAGGSMPIDAGGGSAGPSEATATNSIGGIRNASINFGGSGWQNLASNAPMLLLGLGVVIWAVSR